MSVNYAQWAVFAAARELRYAAASGMLYGNVDADINAEFAIQLLGSPVFAVDHPIALGGKTPNCSTEQQAHRERWRFVICYLICS